MRNKIKISSVIILLLLTSLFYPVNAFDVTINQLSKSYANEIEVEKTVWDPNINEWVDFYEADIDETVTFNITITYKKTCQDGENATDIVVNDTLPIGLSFIESDPFNESYIDGNLIVWNLTADYGIILKDNESISIEFSASVDEYGNFENCVEVFAFELCCHEDLYGIDYATINAEAPPYIEFDKYVYDPDEEEWIELLDSVIIDQTVRFKIDVTFVWHENISLMKYMIVEDYLPACCLAYDEGSEEFEYPSQDFEDPEINVTSNHIIYDWSEKEFNLFPGETISILFNSTVIEYSQSIVDNFATVDLWNCSTSLDPIHITANDTASVNCTAQPSTFFKWIKNPDSGEWVEQIEVYIEEIVTFKLELTYYGNYNFSNISIVDDLPCALEFIEGSSDPEETFVSQDLKTIWWNFTGPLDDSETLTIEFDAEVVDENCGDAGINTALVSAYENIDIFSSMDTAGIIVLTNKPPCPPDITGDTFGEPDQELTFKTIGIDPDGDDIFYKIDWGDGTETDWIGPLESGTGITETHVWEAEGEYTVRSRLKDDPHEELSLWSLYPVELIIEKIPRSLNVELKRGFQRGITFDIENDGEGDVNDIVWSIKITRRGLIKRVLLDESSTITNLRPGEEFEINELPKFCFWLIDVELTVDSPDIENPIEISAKGFIMFRFIRLRRFF